MKNWEFTIGVDVSKSKLDIYCLEVNQHVVITNDNKGFSAFSKWLKEHKIKPEESFVCMEHTGGYEFSFMKYLELFEIKTRRLHPLEVKLSMGMVRGKNDKIDAIRIAEYADQKRRSLKPEPPLDKAIMELKPLIKARKKLVADRAGHKVTITERKKKHKVNDTDTLVIAYTKLNKTLDKEISNIEKRIREIIKGNEAYKRNYELLISIKGIGFINAVTHIVYTSNFEAFTDARKYAAYVGIVPYDHESGSSIKGRKKVSHLCRKDIRAELTNAARSAAQHDNEMKAYLARKMEEGKSYGCALNVVKFKLVARIFSVIRRGEKYVDNYTPQVLRA